MWPFSTWPLVWPWLNSDSINYWPPTLRPDAEKLHRAKKLAEKLGPNLLPQLQFSATQQCLETALGIATYLQSPVRRTLPTAPAQKMFGTTALRQMGPQHGQPLLVIPSLINRYHVLDLSDDCSLLRWLAHKNFCVWLVDWQTPGEAEENFSLNHYVARLVDIYAHVCRVGRAPAVLGYCLGGLLALPMVQLAKVPPPTLALLATPWDLHAPHARLSQGCAFWLQQWRAGLQAGQPLTAMQQTQMFASLQPLLAATKFRRVGQMGEKSLAHFVLLEDWLHGGPPVPARAALQLLDDFYGHNLPARGLWRLKGETINPARITVPTLAVVPEDDVIVPPESALALVSRMPRITLHQPPLGHVGMIVSSRARQEVWEKLAEFLLV